MRVLFVTNEPVGERRSGPAIRCLELARVVARHHEVTVASLHPTELNQTDLRLLGNALQRKSELAAAVKAGEVVVTQGLALARYPALRRQAKHLVIDLYDPYLFEYLQHAHPQHPEWGYLRQWYRLNQQMLAGDFFLCANERQWDYWAGRLCALGRLNPEEYKRDSNFRKLLDVVPFGIPAELPKKTKPAFREVVPGIGGNDFVLLWAGGLWQWLDPLTPIRAVAAVAIDRPKVKLLFLGANDPNPSNRAMTMATEARELARQLGLLGKSVFFLEQWVAYDERQNFLLEADVGISAHPATTESRFAFRTRVLDYIWAGLPMILSSGDEFGELATRESAGLSVRPEDVEGWKSAIVTLLENRGLRQQIRDRLGHIAPRYTWQNVAQPLLKYCENPYQSRRISGLRKRITPLLSSGFEAFRGLRG